MKLVCVMDGTVPIVVGKVIALDGWTPEAESDRGGEVYVVEVVMPENTTIEWACIDVNENGGVHMAEGRSTLLGAIKCIAEMCDVPLDAVDTVEDGSHYVATYHHDEDDESYAHAFKL